MFFSHHGKVFVQAILPSDLCGFGPVVDLLESSQALVYNRLYIRASPHDAPFLLPVTHLSKSVILKSVPDESDVYTIVKFKVETSVLRFVGPDAHGVNVRSEKHGTLGQFALSCGRLHLAFFIRFVKF